VSPREETETTRATPARRGAGRSRRATRSTGWTRFFAIDQPASSQLTRERMGWSPTGPGFIEDLERGHYFAAGG
jgi:hypothetical protein